LPASEEFASIFTVQLRVITSPAADLEILGAGGERFGAFGNEILDVTALVERGHDEGDGLDFGRSRSHWRANQ